jgi:hypothetical protein
VVRICTGIPGQAALVARVIGLDSVRRFDAGEIAVDAAALAGADQPAAAPAAARPRAAIRRCAAAPKIDGDAADWSDVPEQPIAAGGVIDGGWRMSWDGTKLYACWRIVDRSPWRNHGPDLERLFKTGDAVDLELAVDPAAGDEPGVAHRRIVIAPFGDGVACVLMRPVDGTAPAARAVVYKSPVAERRFDRVEPLAGAEVAVRRSGDGYVVEAALPLAALGLAPRAGLVLRGEVGAIASDEAGLADIARASWAGSATNLVDDLPAEAWLYPARWGEFSFE